MALPGTRLGTRSAAFRRLWTPGRAASLIRQAREETWRVNAWTVNDPAEVRRLRNPGVDGLIGDLRGALLTPWG